MDKAKAAPAILAILAAKKKGEGSKADEHTGYSAACDELWDALKSDDKESFRRAFKSAVDTSDH